MFPIIKDVEEKVNDMDIKIFRETMKNNVFIFFHKMDSKYKSNFWKKSIEGGKKRKEATINKIISDGSKEVESMISDS